MNSLASLLGGGISGPGSGLGFSGGAVFGPGQRQQVYPPQIIRTPARAERVTELTTVVEVKVRRSRRNLTPWSGALALRWY